MFATNWLYSDGLVYVNRGTVKHWIGNGVMVNMVAWGINQFSIRVCWDVCISKSDQDIRLYGKQKVEYFLIPYDGFDAAKIISDVADITSPVFMTPGKGEKSFIKNYRRAPYNEDHNVITIFFSISGWTLVTTDCLINRAMGREGSRAAFPTHRSSRCIPTVIVRSDSEQDVPLEPGTSIATKQSYDRNGHFFAAVNASALFVIKK